MQFFTPANLTPGLHLFVLVGIACALGLVGLGVGWVVERKK